MLQSSSITLAVAALVGVLALVLLTARAARATGLARPTSGRLAVQDSLALDRARRLVIVRCDGRDLLLLVGSTDHVVGWLEPTP